MKFIQTILFFLYPILISGKGFKNVAFLVDTAKFWFNYRQTTNILMYYHQLIKTFPKENIILVTPENIACNPRNSAPGVVSCYDGSDEPNLFAGVTVQYRGRDGWREELLNFIRGLYDEKLPMAKRIQTDEETNIFMIYTGHSGNEYIKIQDTKYILSEEIGHAFTEAYLRKKYRRIYFLSDTCEAFTAFNHVTAPNLIMVGTSLKDEKAYSHGYDDKLRMAKSDSYSFYSIKFLNDPSIKTLEQFENAFDVKELKSNPGYRITIKGKKKSEIMMSEFFENNYEKEIEDVDLNNDLFANITGNFTDSSIFEMENSEIAISQPLRIENQWTYSQMKLTM